MWRILLAFKSYSVKTKRTSQDANLLLALAYLDQVLPVSYSVDVSEVTRRAIHGIYLQWIAAGFSYSNAPRSETLHA